MESFESLAAKQVKYVRCLWTDISGIRRMRVVPLKRFFDSVAKSGVALCQAIQTMPMHCDMVVESTGVTATGEFHLIPDLKTLRQVPHYPAHALVMGSLTDGAAYCPRSILQHAMDKAKKEFGLEILCGYEFEFVLLKNFPAEFTAFDEHIYAEASAVYKTATLLDSICSSLMDQGINVELAHPEACSGQYEISTAASDPIRTADNCIATKETIYELAMQKDLRATFCPKPFDGQPGSGMHCHMSIWKDGVNLVPDRNATYYISESARHFIAGVLHNLPAVMAFTLPSGNSYRRVLPGYWAGAHQIWGVENRDAPIRLCSPSGIASHEFTNFEVKAVDGTCNPYLALAAIIHAGLDGLQHKRVLCAPLSDTESGKSADSLRLLPKSLSEALAELEKNTALLDGFGEYAKHFITTRKCEIGAFANLSVQEERKLISSRF